MRAYDGRAARARYVKYNRHQLKPVLDLPSRAAWALAYDAGDRRMEVSALITAIVVSWAKAWEEQLGPTERKNFLKSIPFSR